MASHTESAPERAFLAEVLAHPDEGPRLIFADWLEENGQTERAEFIRLQCRAGDPVGDPAEARPLVVRQLQLLYRHMHAWAADLAGLVERWEFRRGFVEYASVRAAALVESGEELFRLTPLKELRIEAVQSDHLADLAACPALGRVRVLNL